MREFLSQRNINFTEHNIRYDLDAKQYILETFGVEAVPLLVINGQHIVGFDQAKIEKLLNLIQ